MRSYNYYLLINFLFIFIGCNSPENRNNIQNRDFQTERYGQEIKFMMNAVIPYNIDSCNEIPKLESSYKLVTYVNLQCDPCWGDFLNNKPYLESLNCLPNVSLFCFVLSNEEQFDNYNKNANINFPVFLDVAQRFKKVNLLGDFSPYLTFLLNSNNQIVLIGEPSNYDIFFKYFSIIHEGIE